MNWLAHRRLQRAVTAWVDGELDTSTAAAVRAHLRQCFDCSGDAELARMVKASLRHLADRDRDAVTTGGCSRRGHLVHVDPGAFDEATLRERIATVYQIEVST